MEPSENREIQRRRLRIILRRLRARTTKTQKEVAEGLDWSPSKLLRIEQGSTSVSTNDLRALLSFYGLTRKEDQEDLVTMARRSRRHLLFHEYRDVMRDDFLRFLQFEASARSIRWFDAAAIPGILQTEEYARALLESAVLLHGFREGRTYDRLVAARTKRQRVLHTTRRPMHFVIDESTVRRRIGGRGVMRRQLEHLKRAVSLEHVRIQVLPFAAGVHPGTVATFTVLDFHDPMDHEVLFVEDARGGYLAADDSDEIGPYIELFQSLARTAAPEITISKLLDDAIEHMGAQDAV